jgi:hypothetical protein
MCRPSSLVTPDRRHRRPPSVAFHPDTRTYDSRYWLWSTKDAKAPDHIHQDPLSIPIGSGTLLPPHVQRPGPSASRSGCPSTDVCYKSIRPSLFFIVVPPLIWHRGLSGTAALDGKQQPGRASQHGGLLLPLPRPLKVSAPPPSLGSTLPLGSRLGGSLKKQTLALGAAPLALPCPERHRSRKGEL